NGDGVYGSINIGFAAGRHRLMVSDESESLASNASITDLTTAATLPAGLVGPGLISPEIYITGMGQGGGGISYTTGLSGNFFDGVQYWTGSGNDTVYIDGTENRMSSLGRTTTMLNTGLGDDQVTTNLQAGAALTVNNQGVANELAQIDNLTINATGGTYTLTFNGHTTGPIAYNAPAFLTGSTAVTAMTLGGKNSVSEVDKLAITADGGTFTMTVNGKTTSALAYNITAAQLQTAIQGLSSIGASNATVVQNPDGTYTITYNKSLGPITTSSDASNLTTGGVQGAIRALTGLGGTTVTGNYLT